MDAYALQHNAEEGHAWGDFFPGAAHYTRMLLPRERAVRETADPVCVFSYTERHLQCVWADAQYRPAVLRASNIVRVL